MHTDLEAKIMNEIQAKLLANQEEFWRRGQVEIKRMQQQQKEVADALIKMQDQQSELAVEHQRIKGALVEVTAKFEQVVKQMREVIWALPPQMWQQAQQGKPSGSPRGAEEAGVADLHKEPEADQGATFGQLPRPQKTCEPDSQEVALCTPPRTCAQDAPGIATASSPAVLSLASALPSSVSPGFKMLNLAEWIPDQASTGKSTQTPSLPTRSKRMSLSSGADEHTFDTFQVEIVKEMGFTTLGIEVNQEHGALRVEHIDEHGLVGKFNLQESTRKIMEGDCIVEVNGVEQDPEKMLHEIKAAKALGLVLVRPQADSPLTKLRPEAQAFVPLEHGDRALCGGSPSRDADAAEHSGSSDSMKVNRTLFVDELVGNNSGRSCAQ